MSATVSISCRPAAATSIAGRTPRGQLVRSQRPAVGPVGAWPRRRMLSETLEPFRPWQQHHHQQLHQRGSSSRLRVADLQRPVADASEPDIEAQLAAGLGQRSSSGVPGQPLDLSAVLETEVTRQRLRDTLAHSASFSGRQSGQPAAAGAGDHLPGHAGVASSSSSVQGAVAAAAGGHSHHQQQHGSSSSSSSNGRPQPGHASRQHTGPSDQVLTDIAATSSSSSSHTGAPDERTPLLHARRPQHTQQQQGDAATASSSSAGVQDHLQQQQQPGEGEAGDKGPKLRGGIPHSIFVLSMVSMALTSASCVFNTLLPIYMVTELKMTMRSMGMFEGMLEAFSYVVRMFSGVLSDRMASRKAAITAGFTMGALAKLAMTFAAGVPALFLGKAVDRLGNGVQAAPRDALIGDLSPAASRSACFGFAQSMRKWGSFMGAGLAFALMKASGNNYQAIFLLAAGVSALATLAFVVFVPAHATKATPAAPSTAATAAGSVPASSSSKAAQGGGFWEQVVQVGRDVASMGSDFWRTLGVIALYGMGHINESLLEARAIEVGFGKAESTLVVALLCFSIFLCAYPLGRLDDKYGHRVTFVLGMASLIAGDLILCTSGVWPGAVFAACLCWGVHWAVVQGPMLAVVVGLAPPHLKGTAFGIFYSVMAVTAMAANTMFGSVWHTMGATTAFGLSAAIITAALVVMPFLLPASAGRGRGAGPAPGVKVAPA